MLREIRDPAAGCPHNKKEEARRGLLKIMIDRFSSTPLQQEEYSTSDTLLLRHRLAEERNDLEYDASLTKSERRYLANILQNGDTSSIQSASARLQDESLFPRKKNLEGVDSGSSDGSHKEMEDNGENDDDDILDHGNGEDAVVQSKAPRDSLIQQQLFMLHESEPEHHPSELLLKMKRMERKNSILADDSINDRSTISDRISETASIVRIRSLSPTVIDAESRQQPPPTCLTSVTTAQIPSFVAVDPQLTLPGDLSRTEEAVSYGKATAESSPHWSGFEDNTTNQIHLMDKKLQRSEDKIIHHWNPFEDISSWLDGSQGVEVSDSGLEFPRRIVTTGDDGLVVNGGEEGLKSSAIIGAPFRILGLSIGDVSCHPHVLSPPLMESLLAFVPDFTTGTIDTTYSGDCAQLNCVNDSTLNASETPASSSVSSPTPQPLPTMPLSSYNFWLKYSLVRDGAGLWNFLRQVRASTLCFLAIETDEGHVFGAFTSQPWRLAKGWYGSKDTFLWKMRRPRLEISCKSIVEQVAQESEIQVYPYRTGNAAVQYCSKKCLMLGQGEIIPSPTFHDPNKPKAAGPNGKHYGYALYLDKDLQHGTTSTSETFGNPCLIDSNARGARFNVSNIEVWTLTPHDTVAEAEQSELSNLFLDGGRDSAHRLNFMNILVGGPI